MDDDTRDMLFALTREVSRLSTLVETNIKAGDAAEPRLRKLEKWMYALPVAYLLTLGSLFTTLSRTTGK